MARNIWAQRATTGTIDTIARRPNSTMGNPAWQFTMTDGRVFRTAANTSCAYEVHMGLEGRTVRFELSGRGTVIGIAEVPQTSADADRQAYELTGIRLIRPTR